MAIGWRALIALVKIAVVESVDHCGQFLGIGKLQNIVFDHHEKQPII